MALLFPACLRTLMIEVATRALSPADNLVGSASGQKSAGSASVLVGTDATPGGSGVPKAVGLGAGPTGHLCEH